jgi:hypothetical protein
MQLGLGQGDTRAVLDTVGFDKRVVDTGKPVAGLGLSVQLEQKGLAHRQGGDMQQEEALQALDVLAAGEADKLVDMGQACKVRAGAGTGQVQA